MGWCGRAGCSPASVTLVRPLAFGSGSIPDKAGFTNPRSISQREINSSGRLDLCAAFPTNFDCFTHFLPHTSRWRLIVSTRLARTLASRPARRPLRLATRFTPCLKLIQQMARVPALQLRLLGFCIDRREPIEAGVRIEAAERAKTDESKKVAFHGAAPIRTRRLDASALRGIAFRGHLTSLPAGGRSGRTENAREIPARSFRRAFSVRLRIIAADGERRNTGKSVYRCRTGGTRISRYGLGLEIRPGRFPAVEESCAFRSTRPRAGPRLQEASFAAPVLQKDAHIREHRQD